MALGPCHLVPYLGQYFDTGVEKKGKLAKNLDPSIAGLLLIMLMNSLAIHWRYARVPSRTYITYIMRDVG